MKWWGEGGKVGYVITQDDFIDRMMKVKNFASDLVKRMGNPF